MMKRFLAARLLSLMIVMFTPSLATAQGWSLDGYVGRAIYDGVSADVVGTSGVLGIRYRGVRSSWFYISAAAPVTADGPFWGATGLGGRASVGRDRFSAGLDLGAHGHAYRDPSFGSFGAAGTLEALPFLSVAGGPARLELRSGLQQYASSFAGQTQSRTLHESGASLFLSADVPLEVAAEARYVRAEEEDYPYAGASAALDHGKGEVWASVGRWFADAIPGLSWSTGASLRLGQRTEFWAAVRQQSTDPLYWNDSRRSWNLGISRRLGRTRSFPTPLPAEISEGRVTIRVPLSEARVAPFVAGDFSHWNPIPMSRSGQFWTADIALESGVYHYAFRTGSGEWFVPESTPGRREDGFGGFVATLVVP
jgi:hypothetical protein